MAGTGMPTFTRVMVVAPSTRVDVALPVDVPVTELVPMLLDMVGERSDDGGSTHDGWQLTTDRGSAIDPVVSLASADVLDGAVLHLTPARPSETGPIFDDVVDAIATSVRERTDDRAAREVAGAVAVATAIGAALIVLEIGPSGPLPSVIAATASVLALVVGMLSARFAADRLALTLGAGAVAAAVVAAHLWLDGADTEAVVVLTAAAGLSASILAAATIGRGTVLFAGTGAVSGLILIGGLLALVWPAELTDLAIVVGTVSVALVVMVPAIAMRLARLPMPVIPTSSEDLVQEAISTDFDAIRRRAALALHYVVGLSMGCAVVASGGAALALARGGWWPTLYAVVVAVILLLRMRSVPGRGLRLGLLLTAVVALGAGAVMVGMAAAESLIMPLAATCLLLAAVAVGVTVLAARTTRSPMAGRSLDIVENLSLIAVLPLAMAAIDLFATARSL